jgi:hypothetical protein
LTLNATHGIDAKDRLCVSSMQQHPAPFEKLQWWRSRHNHVRSRPRPITGQTRRGSDWPQRFCSTARNGRAAGERVTVGREGSAPPSAPPD